MTATAPRAISLSALDWLAVAVFLLLTAGVALRARLGRRGSAEDYFLAGRSQHWLIVAITLFAAIFSSISFVAIPGEAYGHGLLLSLPLFLMPPAVALGVWLFLRFFFLGPTCTAYEYLEKRFNVGTRVAGALIFCLTRLIYAGVVFYAAAMLCRSLVGWDPLLTVTVVGLFTVAYTTQGGMRAVMATSVIQSIVTVVGVGAVLLKLFALAGFDVAAVYRYAAERGHGFEALASPTFYRLNLHDRFSFWLAVYTVAVAQLSALSCDQMVVQRLLTSKGYASARRAVMTQAFISVPIVLLFWAVGLGLFYYYGRNPDRLPGGIGADQVMGHFIATELPAPLPGLVVAALLAALMDTISSVVNSAATVISRDLLVRGGWVAPGSRRELTLGQLLSAGAGLAAVGVAALLVVGGEGVTSTVMEINTVWGGLWGVLLAAFLLGVLVPSVGGAAVLTGLIAGAALALSLPYFLYYNVPPDQRISFAWLGLPPLLAALGLPLGMSLVWPNRRGLRGLTLWTVPQRRDITEAPAPPPPELEAQRGDAPPGAEVST